MLNLYFASTTETANPNNLKMGMFPFFYFNGDCNDPNTQAKMKQDFLAFLRTPGAAPSTVCGNITYCNENTVTVYCSNVTVPEARRRRSPLMQVNVKYTAATEHCFPLVVHILSIKDTVIAFKQAFHQSFYFFLFNSEN